MVTLTQKMTNIYANVAINLYKQINDEYDFVDGFVIEQLRVFKYFKWFIILQSAKD